jgi:hypothetical protein
LIVLVKLRPLYEDSMIYRPSAREDEGGLRVDVDQRTRARGWRGEHMGDEDIISMACAVRQRLRVWLGSELRRWKAALGVGGA